MTTVAALFVAPNGPYVGLDGVIPWDESRDARLYAGPHPVIAHPPCERWGRYWHGGPSARERRVLGDDAGCFEAALRSLRTYGGVLEHPAHTHAWARFDLTRPTCGQGWEPSSCAEGFVAHVEQGHYGHRARKATWLFVVGVPKARLPSLEWGPCEGRERLDEGFHSAEERRVARAAGQKPRARLSARECLETPIPFRDILLGLARAVER